LWSEDVVDVGERWHLEPMYATLAATEDPLEQLHFTFEYIPLIPHLIAPSFSHLFPIFDNI
jgi:hypothetical protein